MGVDTTASSRGTSAAKRPPVRGGAGAPAPEGCANGDPGTERSPRRSNGARTDARSRGPPDDCRWSGSLPLPWPRTAPPGSGDAAGQDRGSERTRARTIGPRLPEPLSASGASPAPRDGSPNERILGSQPTECRRVPDPSSSPPTIRAPCRVEALPGCTRTPEG